MKDMETINFISYGHLYNELIFTNIFLWQPPFLFVLLKYAIIQLVLKYNLLQTMVVAVDIQ
jgi:hypothetical protein